MPKRGLEQLMNFVAVLGGGGVATGALYDSGNTIPIASGDSSPSTTDGTDFGTSPVGTTVTKTFTYRNTGTAPLTVTAISVPSNYTLLTSVPFTINPASNTTFQIRLSAGAIDPSPNVTYSGTVTISSNATNSSYTFSITGIIEVAFLLRDDFNSGSVAAGTRTATHVGQDVITDASTLLSIATDLVQATGGGSNSPKIVGNSSYARSAGRMTAIKTASIGVSSSDQFGWSSISGGTTVTHMINFNNTTIRINPNFPTLDNNFNDCPYWRCIVLRANGAYYFIRGGKWGSWQLLHVERATSTTTPLYPSWLNVLTPAKRYSDLLVPDVLWTPTPKVSDSFNRADGAIGTSDSYEGGTSTAWNSAVGTANVASNSASFSALSGGVGVATIESNVVSQSVAVALTRNAGNLGLVIRHDGSNNYLYAYHDGTNVHLSKVVAGTPTADVVTSKAITYSAGADLVAHVSANEVSVTYNNVHLAASPYTITDNGLLTGTKVGIYSTDTGNTFDNFIAWDRGTLGAYDSYLSVYAQRTETEKIYLAFDGDSLTVGTQGLSSDGTDSYPRQAMTTLGRATYDYCNYAVSGQTIVQLLSDDEYTVGALAACYTRKICLVWAGSNDLAVSHASATTVYNNIVSYAQAQLALGYKVIVGTIIVRTNITGADETSRTTINSNLIANAASLGITVVDLASDPALDDFNDTTYFNADKVHLKAAGYLAVATAMITAIQAQSF